MSPNAIRRIPSIYMVKMVELIDRGRSRESPTPRVNTLQPGHQIITVINHPPAPRKWWRRSSQEVQVE